MSSTGRGAARAENDFYRTPDWCVHRFLEVNTGLRGGLWLDPCVGSGAIPVAARAVRPEIEWLTIDVDPRHSADLTQDFLTLKKARSVNAIVMNPPYSLAFEFVKHALDLCPEVVALLRLSWLASAKRSGWLRANMPNVYVLPNRPSFTGDGKTDSADYMWAHWTGGGGNTGGGLTRVLANTPAEERRKG